jgi:hypothetical protein
MPKLIDLEDSAGEIYSHWELIVCFSERETSFSQGSQHRW